VVKRLGAIVGAVALVAIAVLVRGRLAGSDGNGRSPGGGGRSGGDLVVACTPELAEVCAALADAGAIAADPPALDLGGATAPPDTVDAWLTWDPAPAIANFDAPAPRWDRVEPLGSAPLGALIGPDDLGGACRAAPTWECVAAAGTGQGGTGIGLGATDTAEGLARILPVATALVPDRDPESIEGARLRTLLESPVDGPGTAADLVARRLQRGAAAVGPVVAPVPLAGDAAATPRGREQSLRAVVPTGGGTGAATVVVAARTGASVDTSALARRCRDDAVAAALRAVGVEPCSGTLAGDDIAGFLYQVREKVG
jgi:hypothetical protein